MSDLSFRCPHCDQPLTAEADMSGLQFDCPSCSHPLVIPAPPASMIGALGHSDGAEAAAPGTSTRNPPRPASSVTRTSSRRRMVIPRAQMEQSAAVTTRHRNSGMPVSRSGVSRASASVAMVLLFLLGTCLLIFGILGIGLISPVGSFVSAIGMGLIAIAGSRLRKCTHREIDAPAASTSLQDPIRRAAPSGQPASRPDALGFTFVGAIQRFRKTQSRALGCFVWAGLPLLIVAFAMGMVPDAVRWGREIAWAGLAYVVILGPLCLAIVVSSARRNAVLCPSCARRILPVWRINECLKTNSCPFCGYRPPAEAAHSRAPGKRRVHIRPRI
jgi:DNA-directed RNA polymerase subunit RPC12/RpoP